MAKHSKSLIVFCFFLFLSCSYNNLKSRYFFAEKLWDDKKYQAAVLEFEKITQKDPNGDIGLKALYQAALTQMLFLSQYSEALQKFKLFSEKTENKKEARSAQKFIGEILFSRLENYEKSAAHYEKLLKLQPEIPKEINEEALFLFRLGKSYFFISKFEKAIQNFKEICKKFSQTMWGEKALYELGNSYCVMAGRQDLFQQESGYFYKEGLKSFEEFIKRYPKSEFVIHAKFGVASCLEEMEQLEEAGRKYASLRTEYPTPAVIDIKLKRIAERKIQKQEHAGK